MKSLLLLSFVSLSNAFCCAPVAFTSCCMAYAPPTIVGYQRIPIFAKVPKNRPPPVEESYDVEEIPVPMSSRQQPIIVEESIPHITRTETEPIIIQQAPSYQSTQPRILIQETSAQPLAAPALFLQPQTPVAALPAVAVSSTAPMMATPAVVTGPAQLPVGPFPVATHPVPMAPIMPSAPIIAPFPAGYPPPPMSYQAPPALPPQSPPIPSYNVPQMINAMPPPTAEIHPALPGPAPSDYQMQAYQPKTYLSSAPNAKRLRL